ncbi:MAG: multiple sugar transport system substrate-binding protein [Rhodobacteraceae bacterium HLUCCA09]|nr:MAG: multiple sugar transport system substrate-binding protein [Rhodobacteraceae bacterium HLUCCA09]
MTRPKTSRTSESSGASATRPHRTTFGMNKMGLSDARAAATPVASPIAPSVAPGDALRLIGFLDELCEEVEGTIDLIQTDAHLRMALTLLRNHFEGRTVTPTSLIGASRVPYATATRRLRAMVDAGLIEQRPRTPSGKSFSLHPSPDLLDAWTQLADRVRRLTDTRLGTPKNDPATEDYYYGGSYRTAQSLPPLQVRPDPLRLAGGLRVLAHGDPTFMVMDNLKRQFEQSIGLSIHQRAFSIDRLRDEALRNAERTASRYDIVAVDLPWLGEFVEKGVLLPLDEVIDVARLDPADFHTAGWQATHWGGHPYGVPAQTTPELLFYRKDMFAQAGLEPPATTDALLAAARALHDPVRGVHGIAWNAARGTALGHTVLMTLADFGQPVLDLPAIAGGYDCADLASGDHRPTIDTDAGLAAAEFLLELLAYSPPDILSMSWYERIRPYAAGSVAMAYGYTLLAPYFELDPASPACGQTGFLPHPPGPGGTPVAPVGGYALGLPANLAPERRAAAAEALAVFTSPEAQKLFVQNGSRTNPRYSVGADPEVRRISPIFEAVEAMSWRDELQFWPRPPVPQITEIIRICGEEFHDMLRGLHSPRDTLRKAQSRADALF